MMKVYKRPDEIFTGTRISVGENGTVLIVISKTWDPVNRGGTILAKFPNEKQCSFKYSENDLIPVFIDVIIY